MLVVLVVLVANSTNWFRYHERNSTPANLWAELLENQQSNKEAILILGNSHSYFLNPDIIDSITGFKPYFLCYPAANVEKLY